MKNRSLQLTAYGITAIFRFLKITRLNFSVTLYAVCCLLFAPRLHLKKRATSAHFR